MEDPVKDYIRNGVSSDHESSTDALLAYELNRLSFKERDRINNDIHGIGNDSFEENPELLRTSLEDFSRELENIGDKPAYIASQEFPETYVNTEDFRLMFLRCEHYQASKAAKRMVRYLDTIRDLFGEQVLKRHILLSDFDQESLNYLKRGSKQLLPGRDRSGRRILGNFAVLGSDGPGVPSSQRIKAAIYIVMTTLRDNIDAQKRGLVGLFWVNNLTFDDTKTRSITHARCLSILPFRFRSIHTCLPSNSSQIIEMIQKMHVLVIGTEYRQRLRIHQGSPMECMYILQTFGIQSLQIPINTNTGEIKTQHHHKWLELQRIKDVSIAKNYEFHGIECPQQNDVLFGRGWPKMNHPGNAIFRNTIEENLEAYNEAKGKRDKTVIAWSIVCTLKDMGVRFLRQETNGWWMEVSNEVARQKVSVGFRDARKVRAKSLKDGTLVATAGAHSCEADTTFAGKRKSEEPFSSVSNDTNDAIPIVEEEGSSSVFLNMDMSKRMRCDPCGDSEFL